MFDSLPHHFRDFNLKADVRTIMMLRKSIDKGLIYTLGDMYLVLKGLVPTSPKEYGPFTTAFYKYFLDIDILEGESLDSAILRSKVFQDWKSEQEERIELDDEGIRDTVDRFLNQVHMSTYDIQKMLDGKDILNKDDPDMKDDDSGEADQMPSKQNRGADYSDVDLKELLERMQKVAKQQNRTHRGGSHWIGQGGISPFGNNGVAKGGIRAGGSGGGKMARKVIGDKNFYPVDTKMILQDNNIDVALSFLKGIEEQTSEEVLDIPDTIKFGVKQGGLFLPHMNEKVESKVQVVLLIDNGGYSMTPYVKNVMKLFSKMKRRFAHDLKTYYYHNTIYGGLYSDERRTKFVSLDRVISLDKKYNVFVMGDADMAPYELNQQSVQNWESLKKSFKKMVWLNPMKENYWTGSMTVNVLKQIIPMYPLSPDGIEKAVLKLNRLNKGV